MTSFAETLFQRIENTYQHILAHPFIKGLADGSLPEASFQFYAIQDALYLREFSRGLSLLAAKAPGEDTSIMFNDHAKNAIVVERALHGSFFSSWNLSSQDIYETPMAPTTVLYTSYLMRIAYECPFHEGLGAFLSCYWIYWKVGKELERLSSPTPIYQQWIGTYAGDEFGTVVQQILDLVDDVAETLTEDQKERMAAHFVMTARFEYMFWDMGYHQQAWPI